MNTATYAYPFDTTGTQATNKILGERHVISPPNYRDFHFIVPKAAPFFGGPSLRITLQGGQGNQGRRLIEGQDYHLSHRFQTASKTTARPIYGSITFTDRTLAGVIELEQYQTLGGSWTLNETELLRMLANALTNPRTTTWETVAEVPQQFPVVDHPLDLENLKGTEHVIEAIDKITEAIDSKNEGGLVDHLADRNNPHGVTKAQILLGEVMNYPIADLTQAANGLSNEVYMTSLRTAQAIQQQIGVLFSAHRDRFDNPHQVNKAQVQLGNVDNFATAGQAEAINPEVTNRFMNPQRTHDAITNRLIPVLAHINRADNPHGVTKAQVQLGSVQNLPLATVLEARQGDSDEGYMTPRLTREAIASQVSGTLNGHINRTDNPHGVTKAQVQLGSVENLPLASVTQARLGESNAVYMTAYTVRQAFLEFSSGTIDGHVNRTDNPHQVTKEQVQLGNLVNLPQATFQQAQDGTVDNYMGARITKQLITAMIEAGGDDGHSGRTDNPHNVTKQQIQLGDVMNYAVASMQEAIDGLLDTRYMTPSKTAAIVDARIAAKVDTHIARTDNPHGVTAAQINAYTRSEIDTQMADKLPLRGVAQDSERFNGMLPNQYASSIVSREVLPAVSAVENQDEPGEFLLTGPTWSPLFTYRRDTFNDRTIGEFTIVGGRTSRAAIALHISHDDVFTIDKLDGESGVEIGFTFDAGLVTVYAACEALRHALTLNQTGSLRITVNSTNMIRQSAPAGYTAITRIRDLRPGARFDAGSVQFGHSGFGPVEVNGSLPIEFVNVIDSPTKATTIRTIESEGLDIDNFIPSRFYDRTRDQTTHTDLEGWQLSATGNPQYQLERAGVRIASTGLAQWISPVAYTDYSVEVDIASTGPGAGAAGLCIAHVRDGERSHNLYVLRSPGGLVVRSDAEELPGDFEYKLMSVGENLMQGIAVDHGSTSDGLEWGDGILDADRSSTAYNPANHGWLAAGAVRISVVKEGDIITIQTSQFGSTDLGQGQDVVIDLASDPSLAKYRGAVSYGFVVFDQPHVTFTVATRPDFYVPYVLQEGTAFGEMNRFNGDTWQSQTMRVHGETNKYWPMQPGRTYFSDYDGVPYQVQRNGRLRAARPEAYTRENQVVFTT